MSTSSLRERLWSARRWRSATLSSASSSWAARSSSRPCSSSRPVSRLSSSAFRVSFSFFSSLYLRRRRRCSKQCCGSRIRCRYDPWIRDRGWVNRQDSESGSGSYFQELKNQFFGTKYLLNSLMRIRDWKYSDPGYRMEKIGSGIQDNHLGSATLAVSVWLFRRPVFRFNQFFFH